MGAVLSFALLTSASVEVWSTRMRVESEGAGLWFAIRWAVEAVTGNSSLVGLPEEEEEEFSDWEEGLDRRERFARALLVFSRARAASE